ncbi:hypothetical protein E6R18_24930 [Streptomyces sp. A1277]|uniref:hypothetical protein n=1 Tax=Streptomyces sp. A1277 TaxID=2563103 RepID=UPI0010A26BCB|nr:hypothetical protein [Streptomyces sp. A1277]THA29159.1 hypothetical protein E6R18_24930 [Streptomyces sp. A1277]
MPTNRDLRAQLAAASTRLREVDSPDLADAVDEVLTPRGWAALRATESIRANNLSIFLTAIDRDRITSGAKSARTTISDAVNAGFRKVIAGEYTPQQPETARKGTAKNKVNLNVTPSLALRERVEAKTGMLAAHVAADYLMHEFKAGRYADDYEGAPLAPGAERNPQVPRAIRQLIRDRAKAAGRKVSDDVNEGYRKYLAGEFVPGDVVWVDESDLVNLRITPNDDLHAQVREATGRGVLKVAIAYLLAKYGIDPAKVR